MNIGEIKDIKIEALVHGGDGLGHIDGQVVFVPFAAPDDSLKIRIQSLHHDYALATIEDIITPSSSRITPTCEVFGACGGCQWQHIDYDCQLRAKMELVRQAFFREGKFTTFDLRPIIPSPQKFNYRHRMQFSVKHTDRTPHIGLHKKKTHELSEMKQCAIAHPLINSFLENMREVFSKHDNRFIQGIDITVDGEGKKLLLVFRFKRGDVEEQKLLYTQLKNIMSQVSGAILRTEEYKKARTTLIDQQQILYPTVGYNLYIKPETFIQVNQRGNTVLVQKVMELISQVIGTQRLNILEMHCGAGNFTMPMSKSASRIVGIESCPSTVDLARKGLWTQDITNCQLFSKSDLKGIKFLLRSNHSFDLLLVDPPRCGCKEILEYIPRLGIRHIIYVSCSLPTLARDLGILSQLGYQVDTIQPIDMFPQTHHVECVVRLNKS